MRQKIGRNDPCHCGSGKKYKKCCMDIDTQANQVIATSNEKTTQNESPSVISHTVTGEIFHPVRLYYKLNDKQALHDKFMKMACMDIDEKHARWVWLYIKEAKNLTLGMPYRTIPKHFHPIVIGSFFSHGKTEMYLDVRSIQRAEQAVLFFDKHLGRSLAELTHMAVVYRFEPQTVNNPVFNFDHLFNDAVNISLSDLLGEDTDLSESATEFAEQRTRLLQLTEEEISKPYPEAEKLPLSYYEDGISQLNIALTTSLLVASERAKGNENITKKEILEKLVTQALL